MRCLRLRPPAEPPVARVPFAAILICLTACRSTPDSSARPAPTGDAGAIVIPLVAASARRGRCSRDPDAPSVASPDGALVVYVSTDPTRTDSTATGDVPHEDLCVVRPGAEPRILLAGRSAPDDAGVEATLADFGDLVLSPDRKTLYFSSAGWVTSSAAHAIDLESGKERFLFDGEIAEVIDHGPDEGMLVVKQRRLDEEHPLDSPKYRGRVEVWSILTPGGKVVRRLPAAAGDASE